MKPYSRWSQIKEDASKVIALSRSITQNFFNNQSFKSFIESKSPGFFDLNKNPFQGLKKSIFNKEKDEGILFDKYFCYLIDRKIVSIDTSIECLHDVFQASWNEYFVYSDEDLRKLPNFQRHYKENYASHPDWIKFIDHLTAVFKSLNSEFGELLTDRGLKKNLNSDLWEEKFGLNPSHFEIDLWADGYIIDYKYITSWDDDYILQVFWYLSRLKKITENTDFRLKGIGIFNTYTNTLFKLPIDINNPKIPSFSFLEKASEKVVLSKEQQAIVEAGEAPILINAGPGSGKTEVLGHRVKHLIKNKNVSPGEILLISYSRSAVEKLKDKIHHLIKDKNISQEITISTFHKLAKDRCQEILKNRISHADLEIMTDKEAKSLIKKITWLENPYHKDKLNIASKSITKTWYDDFLFWIKQETSKECIPDKNKQALKDENSFYKLINDMSLWKLTYGTSLSYESAQKELHKVIDAFNQDNIRKITCPNKQAWMFDEWLAICLKEWANNSPSKTYEYVFVDEFQDTNILQYSFLEKICKIDLAIGAKKLCCIGDLDQSIFSFSGAFPEIFEKFWLDYKDSLLIKKIEINRRSTKQIVDISQKLIKNIPIQSKFYKNLIPAEGKNNYPVKWIQYKGSAIIIKHITAIIEKEFEDDIFKEHGKRFYLGDIAILSPKVGTKKSKWHIFLNEIKHQLNEWSKSHEQLKNFKNICQLFSKEEDIIDDDDQHLMLRIMHVSSFEYAPLYNDHSDLFDSLTEIMLLIDLEEEEKNKYRQIFLDYSISKSTQDFFVWYKDECYTESFDFIQQIYECKTSISGKLMQLDSYGMKSPNALEETKEVLISIKESIGKFEFFSRLSNMHEYKIYRISRAIIGKFGNICSIHRALNKVMLGDEHYIKTHDPNKIQMMSIHKSKGKEFKYVFIVNLQQNAVDQHAMSQWIKKHNESLDGQLDMDMMSDLKGLQNIQKIDESILEIKKKCKNSQHLKMREKNDKKHISFMKFINSISLRPLEPFMLE